MFNKDEITAIETLIKEYDCEKHYSCKECPFFCENPFCLLDQIRVKILREKYKNLKKVLDKTN